MTAIGTYRKCYKCGCITNNVEATKCECGGFLYLGGRNGILQPAVQQKNKNKRRSNCMGAKMLQRGNRGGGSSWLCLYPPEQIRSCFTITF